MSEDNDDVVVPNESEQEARKFGWLPEDEFKGNTDEWRDAETFLKRGREINGFLRKDMEKLNHKLSQRDAELAEIKATIEEFKTYHNETEARAYKRALEDLKQQKIEAIEAGDGVKVVEIDEQIDAYKEAQKTPPAKQEKAKTDYDKDYVTWAKSNLWFSTDPELQQLALLIGQEINATSPDVKGLDFYEEVSKQVKESRPDKFENPARSQASVGSSSDGRSPSTKKKKGYNDLPAEAKAACDRFVKQELMTQEKYLADYQWD